MSPRLCRKLLLRRLVLRRFRLLPRIRVRVVARLIRLVVARFRMLASLALLKRIRIAGLPLLSRRGRFRLLVLIRRLSLILVDWSVVTQIRCL